MNGAQPITNLFSPTEEEALALALSKYWLMARDAVVDPDLPDVQAKQPAVLHYAIELHRACQLELGARDDDVPAAAAGALLTRMARPDWAAPVRRALGDADFDTVDALLSDWEFIAAVLERTVRNRARAVLLTVELCAFYPWPPGTKYEKTTRNAELRDMVDAMDAPISYDYLEELDRALVEQARRLALRHLSWGKLLAGRATASSLLANRRPWLAAEAAVGGASYGAGVLVKEAKGVLGNPLAAGTYGVAGVTLDPGLSTSQAGGSAASLGDLAKLDVLTEYFLIRERNEPDLAKAVAAATEHRLRQTEAEVDELTARLAKVERAADLAEQAAQALEEREAEIERLRAELADTEIARGYQARAAERLATLADQQAPVSG